jgi:16S rRNA (cytosine1402-N4)-methyltransferase
MSRHHLSETPHTMNGDNRHEPVMAQECLHWLTAPERGGLMIDGTVGDGGHAQRFLDRYPSLSLLAVDVDAHMLARARRTLRRFGSRVEFERGWFADVLASRHGTAHLVLLDLGLASYHFDCSARGFSFRRSEPLDMRLDDRLPRTAADILNEEPESALADLFYQYGEERHARRIARAVARRRAASPLRTTGELEELVWLAYPPPQRHRGGIHPATRSFQALRIAVNDELQRLRVGLAAALRCVTAGGSIGVIAFHSLEDRIVKHHLRSAAEPASDADAAWELPTRRPLRPTPAEVRANPRARSARLRVARRVAADG